MNYFDILLAKKLNGGGGGDITVKSLNVTENGTYSEEGVAYSPVNVNVPTPSNAYLLNDIPSGEISTFNADNLPMPSLKVSVEAKQDLHGYDHPWVGGAGKNKYDKNNANNQPNKRVSTGSGGTYAADGYTATYLVEVKPDTDYTLTTSSNFVSYICWYDETQTRIGGTNWSSGTSKTSPSNAKYVRFDFSTADIDKVQLEQGSTATSFEPYSNICPISGWDEAKVSDVGKNLFDKNAAETGKALNRNTGETTTASNWSVSDYINIKENTTYTYSDNEISVTNGIVFCYYDSNKGFISGIYDSPRATRTITTPSNAVYVRFEIRSDALNVLQFELGSTATTYEAYNGVTTTISLGQTVYGGEVDVVNGTSGNKLTHQIETISGGITRTDSSGYLFVVKDLDVPDITNYDTVTPYMESNYLTPYSVNDLRANAVFGFTQYNKRLYIRLGDGITTVADANAFLASNPLQIKYELATPTTLTTQPTPIKSLNGHNNLSVDCGEILEGTAFIKA